MGGKFTFANSKRIPAGEYASVIGEIVLDQKAQKWAAKDGRSGELIAHQAQFGELIEAKK